MTDSAPAPLPVQGNLMRGKRGMIMGVANDRSLAWGIASACAAQGAELAFTFQGDALERRVRPLAAQVGSDLVIPATWPTKPASTRPSPRWRTLGRTGFPRPRHRVRRQAVPPRPLPGHAAGGLPAGDGHLLLLVHAVCQRAVPMMKPGGSLLTLTYLGAERWVPHYNVMGVAKAALEASVRYLAADLGSAGIRCNAISAGPIKTLAASGIGDFRYILRWNQLNSPMQRNVTIEEVGGAGPLPAVRSVVRRDRRGASCRLRLSYRRHEASRRARHRHRGRLTAAAMSHNSFGHLFRVTTWGESHGPAIGGVVDGCPPLLPLTEADIQPWLDKRRPGQSKFTTQRQEPDQVRILSGVFEGLTTGTPISLMIENQDQRSRDYADIADAVPPGPRRPDLRPEIRHPRLSRRRPVLGAGNRDARGRGRRRPPGAGQRRAHPRRAGADRPAPDRPGAMGLGAGRRESVLLPGPGHGPNLGDLPVGGPQIRFLGRRGDRDRRRWRAAWPWARRSTASWTPTLPPR